MQRPGKSHDPDLGRIVKGMVGRGAATTLSEATSIETDALARRKAAGPMSWAAGAARQS